MTPAEQHLAKVRGDLDAVLRHQRAVLRRLEQETYDDMQTDIYLTLEAQTRALASATLAIEALLQELHATATGGVSSVQLEVGAKEIRPTIKVYANSPVREAGDDAIAELERQFNLIRAGQARDWQATVDGLAAAEDA